MSYIVSNVISRILQIKVGNFTGTGFTIEYGDTQYLITAKHIFQNSNFPSKIKIQVFQEGIWKDLDVCVYYHKVQKIDIAVISFDFRNITTRLPIKTQFENLIIGQDMFFGGFPFGLKVENNDLNIGYPIPLFKKSMLSGVINDDGVSMLILDGHNNQGFSGGPVFFSNFENNEIQSSICGVISSYQCYLSPLFDRNGNQTEFYIRENSGIIYAYHIKHVFEIIETIS